MGNERNIFLSTIDEGDAQRSHGCGRRLSGAVRLRRAVCRLAAAPVPAFVASYQSALAINDLITAVLLFSDFAITRSRGLLLLASGYLFTAMAAIVHAHTFPGQLVDEALKRRSHLKTLYTSGYTENAIVHHGRLDSGVRLLARPYRKSELAPMIRLALAS